MNGREADMMEADVAAPPYAPPPEAGSGSGPNDVRNLLAMARQLVDQGKPSQALQAVVMAMKIQGGDEAVSQGLSRARELYVNKIQASAAADELASLFAECAIAEAIPLQPGLSQHKMTEQPIEPDPQGTSILAETGRKQIVLDASSDGSSFVCLQCGGLVSNHRKEEHFAFWCCKARNLENGTALLSSLGYGVGEPMTWYTICVKYPLYLSTLYHQVNWIIE